VPRSQQRGTDDRNTAAFFASENYSQSVSDPAFTPSRPAVSALRYHAVAATSEIPQGRSTLMCCCPTNKREEEDKSGGLTDT